jgi:hypothetical protein
LNVEKKGEYKNTKLGGRQMDGGVPEADMAINGGGCFVPMNGSPKPLGEEKSRFSLKFHFRLTAEAAAGVPHDKK